MRAPGAKMGVYRALVPLLRMLAGWMEFGGQSAAGSAGSTGGARDWVGAGRARLVLAWVWARWMQLRRPQPKSCQRATDCEQAQWAGAMPVCPGRKVGEWAGGPLGRKSLLQRAVARPVASSLKRGLGGVGRLGRLAVKLGALGRGARAPPFFTLFAEYDRRNSIPKPKEGLRVPTKQTEAITNLGTNDKHGLPRGRACV